MSEREQAPETGGMDEAVRRYREEIDSQQRPVFDRLHQLIVATCQDAEVVLSYGMPTYRIGRRRLNIGVWKHGLSLYVSPNRDGGFSARHPELAAGKGTIKLRPQDAACISDAELQDLVRAALRALHRRCRSLPFASPAQTRRSCSLRLQRAISVHRHSVSTPTWAGRTLRVLGLPEAAGKIEPLLREVAAKASARDVVSRAPVAVGRPVRLLPRPGSWLAGMTCSPAYTCG